MDLINIAKEVLLVEAKSLENASKKVNKDISKAINLIINISGKLIVSGVGKSGLVAAKISATLSSTGTSSFFSTSNRSYAW